jgi:hypothetical protein
MAQELDQSAAKYRYILRYLIDPIATLGSGLRNLWDFAARRGSMR